MITEETVISETMETKDHLTVDRRATVTVVAVRSRVVREDQDRAETEDRTTEVKDALAEITVSDREPAAEEEIMMPYSHQN